MPDIQLSVNCKKCGATNRFTQDNIPTFCSFCGSALPNMKQHADEAIRIALEQQRHKMQMEAADKEIQKEQIRSKTQKAKINANMVGNIGKIIVLILTLLIVGFCVYSAYQSMTAFQHR